MKPEQVYVGVDVAKAYLDVAWEKESRRVSNDEAGRKQLLQWLNRVDGQVQVICEASGGYERGLIQALQRKNIKVSLVQAIRVCGSSRRQRKPPLRRGSPAETIHDGCAQPFLGHFLGHDELQAQGIEFAEETEEVRRRLNRIGFRTQNPGGSETPGGPVWRLPGQQADSLARRSRKRLGIIDQPQRSPGRIMRLQLSRGRNDPVLFNLLIYRVFR